LGEKFQFTIIEKEMINRDHRLSSLILYQRYNPSQRLLSTFQIHDSDVAQRFLSTHQIYLDSSQGSSSVYLVFDTLSVEDIFSEDTSYHHPNGRRVVLIRPQLERCVKTTRNLFQ